MVRLPSRVVFQPLLEYHWCQPPIVLFLPIGWPLPLIQPSRCGAGKPPCLRTPITRAQSPYCLCARDIKIISIPGKIFKDRCLSNDRHEPCASLHASCSQLPRHWEVIGALHASLKQALWSDGNVFHDLHSCRRMVKPAPIVDSRVAVTSQPETVRPTPDDWTRVRDGGASTDRSSHVLHPFDIFDLHFTRLWCAVDLSRKTCEPRVCISCTAVKNELCSSQCRHVSSHN
ncbi:hypothetical protein GE09DRAFT_136104 [Coniochaeta sp. 2T2.1]|nr:hypothetical protein GE09DRAFT_136104 [Coniochaeta sp. 2T2.1]